MFLAGLKVKAIEGGVWVRILGCCCFLFLPLLWPTFWSVRFCSAQARFSDSLRTAPQMPSAFALWLCVSKQNKKRTHTHTHKNFQLLAQGLARPSSSNSGRFSHEDVRFLIDCIVRPSTNTSGRWTPRNFALWVDAMATQSTSNSDRSASPKSHSRLQSRPTLGLPRRLSPMILVVANGKVRKAPEKFLNSCGREWKSRQSSGKVPDFKWPRMEKTNIRQHIGGGFSKKNSDTSAEKNCRPENPEKLLNFRRRPGESRKSSGEVPASWRPRMEK